MISAEILTNIGVIVGACLAVLAGHYSKRIFREPPVPPTPTSISQPSAVLAGIGVELATRTHYEQLVAVQTRIAIALEVLADRKIEDMSDMHREIMDRMNDAERRSKEQEEQVPRRPRNRRSAKPS